MRRNFDKLPKKVASVALSAGLSVVALTGAGVKTVESHKTSNHSEVTQTVKPKTMDAFAAEIESKKLPWGEGYQSPYFTMDGVSAIVKLLGGQILRVTLQSEQHTDTVKIFKPAPTDMDQIIVDTYPPGTDMNKDSAQPSATFQFLKDIASYGNEPSQKGFDANLSTYGITKPTYSLVPSYKNFFRTDVCAETYLHEQWGTDFVLSDQLINHAEGVETTEQMEEEVLSLIQSAESQTHPTAISKITVRGIEWPYHDTPPTS